VAIPIIGPWYWGGTPGTLVAFDVSDSTAPKFVSDITVGDEGTGQGTGRGFAADGLLYLSHREFESKTTGTNYYVVTNRVVDTVTNVVTVTIPITVTNEALRTNIVTFATNLTVTNYTQQTTYDYVRRQVVVTNSWPIITWMENHYLDVVDYAIPSNPTVRQPANIPGELQGLSHRGALLYTLARRPATGATNGGGQWLDAVAYDGVEVHRVDSLALPDRWPSPVLVQDATIFLGRPAPTTNSTPQLEAWTLPDTGKFAKLCGLTLSSPAQNLKAFGDLLVTQNNNELQLFNASDSSRLTLIGGGGSAGCVGYNLENADGAAARGLWLPLGIYGVYHVALPQNSSAP